MDLYPVSQPITLSTTVRDIAGALADPTALTLSWKIRGGTPTVKNWPTPADITRDSVGVFHYVIPALAVAGQYLYTWDSSGTNDGAESDVFEVFDPDTYPRLVSLTDAREFLKLTNTNDDAILDRMVGWASARILREVQATIITVTERVFADAGGFVLSTVPVRTVTAITPVMPYSPAVTVGSAYITSKLGGVVELYGTSAAGTYDVTYTAGYDEVPPGAAGACLALIRHWFNQFLAHASATYETGGFVPDFTGLPNVVLNMLAATPRVTGVA